MYLFHLVIIASTTLTSNSADIIGEALLSVVDWVDVCLIIDTGVTDSTLQVAREIAGSKYRAHRWPWTGDYSAARNEALDAAQALGASWAVTLDPDERIEHNGQDMRAAMSAASGGVLMLANAERSYFKERCFRLPAIGRFSGPVHESFPSHQVGYEIIDRALFRELGKSSGALARKFARDIDVLKAYCESHPGEPRWLFYLGESLKGSGRHEEAVGAYDACVELRGWNEEAAWACYGAAECLCALGRFREAVERCALGLARHAGVAELCWLAAFAAFKAGDPEQSVHWARLSITHGSFAGSDAARRRIGFRNPNALYEGPFDVLRVALAVLGDLEGSRNASQSYQRAVAARTRG